MVCEKCGKMLERASDGKYKCPTCERYALKCAMRFSGVACGGALRTGVAIQPTWVDGMVDFTSDAHAVTVYEGGPGRLINVLKCAACGASYKQVKA